MSGQRRRVEGRRRTRIVALGFLSLLVPAIAFYCGIEIGRGILAPPSEQATSAPPSASSGQIQSFEFSFFNEPHSLPELRFVSGDGRALTLGDFRGRPILLNIWATWCVPCRKEMPSLDRLQAKIGASQLLVLPLSIDRQGLPVVKKFYGELGLTALGTFLDQSGTAASKLNTVGVPTTLLIDREGREIGRKIGPAEWDGAETIALLREHLGLLPNEQQASP
jgi:thiol-disulfide isomerase/thioredoxin